MSITVATETVLRAASAHANGHSDCLRILEAVAHLRAYLTDQDEEPRENPSTRAPLTHSITHSPHPMNQLPGDPSYPPGVSERDISYPDPIPCEQCEEGRIIESPCCGQTIITDDEGYRCSACQRAIPDLECPACRGEGVIDP